MNLFLFLPFMTNVVCSLICLCTLKTTNSEACVKRPLSKRPKIGFQDQLSLNADRSSLSYHLTFWSLFCLFLSGRFTQVLLYNSNNMDPVWSVFMVFAFKAKVLWSDFVIYTAEVIRVSNGAKIRNRYNQVPHLTQDTNGKVTNSQKTPQTRAKRSALSQQVTTKHI